MTAAPEALEGAPSSPPAQVDPARHRWLVWLALVALSGLLARLAYGSLLASDLPVGADATWYSLQAATIGGGKGYVDPAAFFGSLHEPIATATFPPLWPALLGLFHWLGAGSDETFRIVGAVIGTATVILTGFLGRAVAGPPCGLVAAAIVAGSPLLIGADGSMMSDSLAVALITAAALLATTAVGNPTPAKLVAVGVLGGLATLARSDAVVYTVFLVVAIAFGGDRSGLTTRQRLALPLLALGVAAAVVTPWVLRNDAQLGRPVLSTNLGSLVAGANCPTTYAGPQIGMWDPRCDVHSRGEARSETKRMSRAVDAGVDHATDELVRLPLIAVVRVARAFGFWDPVAQSRQEAIETRDEGWQGFAWGYALVALALALAGAVMLRRSRAPGGPLVAVVLASIVVVVVSWGNSRFRLAAEPAIAVAAAAFLTTKARARRERRIGPRRPSAP